MRGKTANSRRNSASVFLPNGRAPRTGEIFRNPDLAWSYKLIAKQGRKAFYEGEIARRGLSRADLRTLAELLDGFESKRFSSDEGGSLSGSLEPEPSRVTVPGHSKVWSDPA